MGCKKYMKKFVGDFETVTWLDDETYVWAWALCDISTENIEIGNNIESFFDYLLKYKNPVCYFHNLKFDGEFILYYIMKNGFTYVKNKEDIKDKTFTTLISQMGQFYQITVYFKKENKSYKKITFIDSLKILPFSVEQIAKSFDLPISKLELDYNKPREKGYILNNEEREYIKNDVLIVAKALKILFEEKLTKMTIGSNAITDFKNMMSKSKFLHYFPKLDYELDKDLRRSYKGGFTYLNPIYKDKEIKNINILDVNSLYPYCMYSKQIPIGEPIFYDGKYKDDKVYNLYIQKITCIFEIKKNKIPTIQIKNSVSFRPNEYLKSSDNNYVTLYLTSVDLKLFLEQYDVYDLSYDCGWKFKSVNGIFSEYIDKWIKRKNEATLSGNLGQRTLAKLMLNNIYGKLATSLETKSKIPFLGDDDIVHYYFSETEEKDGIYLPAGSFITAYAREITIRTSQAITDYSLKKYNKDLYVYSDTDSIHTLLSIEELKQFCNIDDVKLGFWKHEGFAKKGKFVRQKTYIEETEKRFRNYL